MTVVPLVFDSLYELDASFEPQPLLAQGGWQGEDGLSWRVTLKSGVTFSNGAALDAASVCAALNAARGEKSLYASRLANVQRVTAEGESTVVFQLKEPNRDFLALLDIPVARVEKDGVYGTGRYVVDGERLVARENSWRESADIPREIPLKSIGAADELIAAFDSEMLGLAASDPTGADALGFPGPIRPGNIPPLPCSIWGFTALGDLSEPPGPRRPQPGGGPG